MKNTFLIFCLFAFFFALMSWEVTHVFAGQGPISQPITAPIVTPSPTTAPISTPNPSCPLGNLGDIDCDGRIWIFDYNILVTNFGKTGANIPGDLDCNGKVDIFDYNILVTNFGR
jgi:hypothetical protein